MGVVTYDPSQVVVLVAGQVISGFAPGTFVSAHYHGNQFKIVRGSEGESTRTLNLDRSGEIRISLLQTSDSNAALSSYADADRSGGLGIFDVLVKDVSGQVQASAAKAWIVQPAGFSNSETVGQRQWVIHAQILDLAVATPDYLGQLLSFVENAAVDIYSGARNFF